MERNSAKAFPPCGRTDCHSCIGGKCRVLNTSVFGDNGCPFYSNNIDYLGNKLTAGKRLRALGRENLITQYYGSKDSLDNMIADTTMKLNELLAAERERIL